MVVSIGYQYWQLWKIEGWQPDKYGPSMAKPNWTGSQTLLNRFGFSSRHLLRLHTVQEGHMQ